MAGLEFVLPPARAAALQTERRLPTLEDLARQLVSEIAPRARAPLSGFQVGAVAVGVSGALYLGVNLEFPPLPINGDTVHGEQSAVALAFVEGERDLTSLITFGGHPW